MNNGGGRLMVSEEVGGGLSLSLIGSVSWWTPIVPQVLGLGLVLSVCVWVFFCFLWKLDLQLTFYLLEYLCKFWL